MIKKYDGTAYVNQDILDLWDIMSRVASEKYDLTWYEPQFEIMNPEGMSSVSRLCHGVPNFYDHWSHGKSFLDYWEKYQNGEAGELYEMVINSNPSICYILQGCPLSEIISVMTHAAIGHSSFFRNNFMFQAQTDASSIIPFMDTAKKYILQCEGKYGFRKVERILDCLHALSLQSVDSRLETLKKTRYEMEEFQKSIDELVRTSINPDLDTGTARPELSSDDADRKFYHHYETDNIMKCFLKYGDLPEWVNNIIRIHMYIQQYFSPQGETKLMNEGYAEFWQNRLLMDMYDDGHLSEGIVLQALSMDSGVRYQPWFSRLQYRMDENFVKTKRPCCNNRYNGNNPYYLGYAMFMEIERVCNEQDAESLRAVPSLKGMNWIEGIKFAMENFTDNSFVGQFLTPNLVRKLKLAVISTPPVHASRSAIMEHGPVTRTVAHASDDSDFMELRRKVSANYGFRNQFPHIISSVTSNLYDPEGHGSRRRMVPLLTLTYENYNGRHLHEGYRKKTVALIERLWRHPVKFVHKNERDK